MTKDDEAFYTRRMREELNRASSVKGRRLRNLHLRWALLYQERLDATPKAVNRTLEGRLRSAGYQLGSIAELGDDIIIIKLPCYRGPSLYDANA